MRLRDTFITDLSTFLNADEFAEARTIDGVEGIVCVLQDPVNNGQLGAGDPDVVITSELWVAAADLPRAPQVDRTTMINGVKYMVLEHVTEEGMTRLTLSKHTSN